jgi:uridylate kinase
MARSPRYRRVLVKLSGESLSGAGQFGMDARAVSFLLDEIAPVAETGVELALVVGGGNFLRGRDLAAGPAVERVTADYMGMLATVINALLLRDSLAERGIPARVMSAIPMTTVCETFTRQRAMHHLGEGRVVLLAAGTGSPFFTTDVCAALRASELAADVLMKATKVDGVFDSDPAQNPNARKYDRLSYQQVLADRLGVMELAAVSMCMEQRLPILVFQISRPGNLARAVAGESVGTLIAD